MDFAQAIHRIANASAAEIAGLASQMLERLRCEKEVRVFVDGTRNLGHQSASINLAQLLVERSGFKGTLTFVYADYRRRLLGNQRRKLALLGGFDESQWPSIHVRWVEISESSKLPPIRFAMTGGADDLSINYARRLNADWFMRLQPFLWDDPPDAAESPTFVCSRIERRDNRCLYFFNALPGFRRMWLPRANRRASGPLSRRDRDIARQIVTMYRNGHLLWPVYGVQHFGRHGTAIIHALILAGEQLWKRRRRKVAILCFSPLTIDPKKTDWLRSNAQEISFIPCGPVGARLYRRVNASSKLPPIVEGQESTSQLIDLRRPFLQLRRADRTSGFELNDIVPHRLAQHLDGLSRNLVENRSSSYEKNSPLVEELANFLCNCLDGDSETLRYFSSLKPTSGPDKFDFALAVLRQML